MRLRDPRLSPADHPEGFAFHPQVGHNLGQRLDNLLTACLNRGYEQVAAMNSDGPTLPAAYVRRAFDLVDSSEVNVVLGPSNDGGYYLIDLRRPCPALFDVAMSTPTVLPETLERACEQGRRTACLPVWYDVDTPEDLQRLVEELPSVPGHVAVTTRQLLARWMRGKGTDSR